METYSLNGFIWKYLLNKSSSCKIFEEEMLIRCQTTNLIEILYEILRFSQIILKSISLGDDTFYGNFDYEWVNVAGRLLCVW